MYNSSGYCCSLFVCVVWGEGKEESGVGWDGKWEEEHEAIGDG